MSKSRRRDVPFRNRQRRPPKRRILIVCEGRETERHYFDQLKREDAVAGRFAVTVIKGRGGSREQIAGHAVDRKHDPEAEFGQVWCVLDVQTQSHHESLGKALYLLNENDITACLSNPSFEVWFLAHFERTKRAFKNGDAVVIALNKHWRQEFGLDYVKSDQQVYRRLKDRTDAAIENARNVRTRDHEAGKETCDCNSSTDVFRLVGLLLTREP